MIPQLTEDQKKTILSFNYFSINPRWANLNINETIKYFYNLYINPLENLGLNLQQHILIDCGCGLGWFSWAFLLKKGSFVILIDRDKDRVKTCKKIAELLGFSKNTVAIVADITDIPIRSNTATIFSSLQTLEYVGIKDKRKQRAFLVKKAFSEMKRTTTQAFVINVPNHAFFIDGHDTGLPFIHWFPQKFRSWIALKFRIAQTREYESRGLTPWAVNKMVKPFLRITKYRCFSNYQGYQKNRSNYCHYNIAPVPLEPTWAKYIRSFWARTVDYYPTAATFLYPVVEGIYMKKEAK